jgi:co-chaperonin GroES (HSP10)
LFGKYSGNDITIDDEEYMILKEDEILAKIGGSAKAAGGKK